MKFADIGLDENRGGSVSFVNGVVAKNEPYKFTDSDTKQVREGYSFHVAFFGGVLNITTSDGDPLRLLGVGEPVTLRIRYTAPKGKPIQMGPALEVDPKTLQPVNNIPSSA